ncbi:MAG: hypothetical protein WCF67_06605 [Chitinophagaceae bacterium]
MKRSLYLLAVLFVLASCQKEVGFDTPPGSGGSGGGGGTGTGGGGTLPDTYQPVTKDSYWKYKDSAFTGLITLMTATGQQKTINSKIYQVIKSETTGQPVAEGYFYTAKPIYGLRQDVNNGIATTIEFTYLNDTASVGYKWTENMAPVNGNPARFHGTIMERNISKTVAGKNFTNVIHTQLLLEYELPFFGWTEFAVYNYYVAKGIGIIRIETEFTAFGQTGFRTVSDLIDYSIK